VKKLLPVLFVLSLALSALAFYKITF